MKKIGLIHRKNRSLTVFNVLLLLIAMMIPLICSQLDIGLDIVGVNASSSSTTIFIDPSEINASTLEVPPGDNFTIKVNVSEVADLYAFEFYLFWDSPLLNWTDAVEGGFLGHYDNETWIPAPLTLKDYQDYGWLQISSTLTGDPPPPGVSGNGTLAIVTFLVEDRGETTIEFYNSKLVKLLGPTPEEIPHTAIGGYFSNEVPIIGDVDGDGDVDASDLIALGEAYGSEPGDTNWDERCDFNDDNKVDASDIYDLSRNYGKTNP